MKGIGQNFNDFLEEQGLTDAVNKLAAKKEAKLKKKRRYTVDVQCRASDTYIIYAESEKEAKDKAEKRFIDEYECDYAIDSEVRKTKKRSRK